MKRSYCVRKVFFPIFLLIVLALALAASAPSALASPAVAPSSVTIAGSLDTEIGCGSDWDPGCGTAHLTYAPKASMLPDATGDYDYLYRYTTTNGRDWVYADQNCIFQTTDLPPNPGRMTVSPSDDTTPPAAPTNLMVDSSSPTDINLKWGPVSGDPSMYGYEVRRSGTSGGPYTTLALVTGTTYDDNSVTQGATYYYVVRAVDQSFNRSGNSNEVLATADPRKVNITFNVTVPAYTDASAKSVYIAGTLSLLDGGHPDWDPGAVVLTKVDSTHWTITLTGNEAVQVQYKYTLGSWDYVEKDSSCGEINNRMVTLTYGSNGNQTVNDTVQNWRNSNQFGGSCEN